MIKKEVYRKTRAKGIVVVLAMAILLFPAAVFAAAKTDSANNTASKNDLEQGHIIDTDSTGSLTIYKYDITAAQAAGDFTAGDYEATGEKDTGVEDALAKYAIQGVQFTYLKVGEMEQYTKSGSADGSNTYLVYEIPKALQAILKLKTADAVNMTAPGVAVPCSKAGVYHYTGTQISDPLAAILAADEIGAKNDLEAYLYTYNTQDVDTDDSVNHGAANMPETDGDGMTSVSGLPLGLYLIAETGVPENVTDTVNPWFASLPFTDAVTGDTWLYDMVCYPKNQTGNPTLDKKVCKTYGNTEDSDIKGTVNEGTEYSDTTTASDGDLLEYILVSKLPHITSTATYLSEYTFTDQLTKGITYNQDAKIALYKTEADAAANNTAYAVEIWNLTTGQYEQSYDDVESADGAAGSTIAGQRMVIRLTEAGLRQINGTSNSATGSQNGSRWTEKDGYSDYYMVVYYTATVNSDASVVLGDEGNVNDVELQWSRTNTAFTNVLQDRNYVYVYGMDLTKTFSDNKGDARAVQFTLYNRTDAYYVVARAAEDGLYYVTGKTTDQAKATAFVPSAEGRLYVNGLEADTYQLTEIATDTGYTLLKEQVEISITATNREILAATAGSLETTDLYVGEVQCASATVDKMAANMARGTADTADQDSENARVVLRIVNNKGFLLPQTGGSGLYAITILGVILAGCGCMVICRKKKRKA